MVLPFQLCQLQHTLLSGVVPLPACSSPWQTSVTLAPPTSWVSGRVQASSSQLHAVASPSSHAETPLPYTWPQPFPRGGFHNPCTYPCIPHDSKAWTTQLMLPSSAACLEWNLAPSVSHICIIFDLLMLFGSRKPFRPLRFINCRII